MKGVGTAKSFSPKRQLIVPASFFTFPPHWFGKPSLSSTKASYVDVILSFHTGYVRSVTLSFVSDFTVAFITLYCNLLLIPLSPLLGYELSNSFTGSSMVLASQKLINRFWWIGGNSRPCDSQEARWTGWDEWSQSLLAALCLGDCTTGFGNKNIASQFGKE